MKPALALLLLLLLALPVTAQVAPGASDEESSLEYDLRTVATLTAAGAYSDALSLAQGLILEHPDSLEAHIVYQDLRLATGVRKELVKEYAARAGGSGPKPDNMYLHARLLEGSKALNLFRKVLRLEPKHFHALCAIGTYYVKVEKFRDAEQKLLLATQVRRSSAVPWNGLGCLEERRGDLQRAEEYYRKAIEGDPGHAVAHLNLGTLLILAEKLDEAEEVLAQAAKLAPGSPMPILARGLLLLVREKLPAEEEEEGDAEEGDEEGAGEESEEGEGNEEEKPDPELELEKLKDFGKEGEDPDKEAENNEDEENAEEEETAVSLFEQAVELKSNTFTSLNMLGLACTDLREFGLAKRAFSRAIALNKDNPLTYLNLCHMSLEMWQPDQARSWVRQALRLESKSPQAYYFTGLCEKARGKNRSAESAFLRATKLDGENVLYWRTLGTHYATLGKWKEAVRIFTRAIDLVGETIELTLDLAFSYTGVGAYGRAAGLFESVVEADPEQLSAWLNLGLLYKEKLRSSQKAIFAFEEYKANGGDDERVDTWLAELKK